MQALAAATVALTIDAASAEHDRHAKARNIFITRKCAAVIKAKLLGFGLNACLRRNQEAVSLRTQAKKVLLGVLGSTKESRLAGNVLSLQAHHS